MDINQQMAERLKKSLELYVSSGYGERNPEKMENLINKIKALQYGASFKVVDVTEQLLKDVASGICDNVKSREKWYKNNRQNKKSKIQ